MVSGENGCREFEEWGGGWCLRGKDGKESWGAEKVQRTGSTGSALANSIQCKMLLSSPCTISTTPFQTKLHGADSY